MVRIEPKTNLYLVVGSLAFSLSGVLLLIYPPHGDDMFSRIAEALTPYIQIASILFGLAGVHRQMTLAVQRTAVIAADATGISIDGATAIPWSEVTEIAPYEYRMQGTHRGILIKLRD
ncbi:MAG: hypothetical protein JWO36_4916, partial [Myxococcales bacterium]|nr:hypothetical protein [Myxococcales bacterium]